MRTLASPWKNMTPLCGVVSQLAALLLLWSMPCGLALKHTNTAEEAHLCLSRVAPLPKAEGYSSLCTSIAALYQQQQNAASSFHAIQQEGQKMSVSYTALQKKTDMLEKENKELERHNHELEKRLEELLVHQIALEKKTQTDAKDLQEGVARRDDMWKAVVRRLQAEKTALGQQASLLQEWAKEASTSAAAERKRASLLAQHREAKSKDGEGKEVQALMQQSLESQSRN